MYTLDTNILIYYSKGDKDVASFMNQNKEQVFYLPTIVALEFLSHPVIDEETIKLFKLFTTQTALVSLDMTVAERAADIRRIYKVKLADAIIAATAIFTSSVLVTRNERDFKKVVGLQIIHI